MSKKQQEGSLAEVIQLLYKENCANWRHFLDYRHKFTVRYFLTVGSIVLLARHIELLNIAHVWFVLLLISGISFLFLFIERRTTIVLVGAHKIGRDLEDILNDRISHQMRKYWSDRNERREKRKNETGGTLAPWDKKIWVELGAHLVDNERIGYFTALTAGFNQSRSHSMIILSFYLLCAGATALAALGWGIVGIYEDPSNWQAWTEMILGLVFVGLSVGMCRSLYRPRCATES